MGLLPGVVFRRPPQRKRRTQVEGDVTVGSVGPGYTPGSIPAAEGYTVTPYPKSNPTNVPPADANRVFDPQDPLNPLTYGKSTLYDYPGKYVGVNPHQTALVYNRNGELVDAAPMQAPGNTDKVLRSFETADYKTVQATQKMLSDAGLLSSSAYVPGRWDGASKAAMYVAMQEANRNGMPWAQYLRATAEGEGSGGTGGPGGGPKTTVQTIYSYTTKNKASMMIEQAMQEAMGRAPTAAEKRRFIRELRSEEEANPTVVTTTTDAKAGTSTTTTEPGLEPDAWLADTYIEDVKPGKQERYKKAQYENLLMSMMSDGSL